MAGAKSKFLGDRYGLRTTLALAAAAKIAIFLVGVAIFGFAISRTAVVSGSATPNMFALDQWSHVEAYTDYRDLYLRDLVGPFLQGKNIYYLGTIVYNYPPLFLYILGGFADLVNIAWFPATSLILFDVLTVIPFYLIAKKFVFAGESKPAFAASVIWALNPINLFYNDLMWLNPPYTTFFLMLSLYLLLEKKWLFSSLSLAVSTGFKQITVLLFPIVLLLIWKATGFSKKLLAYVLTYIAALILISSPYIWPQPYTGGGFNVNFLGYHVNLTSAQNYFWSLNFPILGYPSNVSNAPPTFSASLSAPIQLTYFLGILPGLNLQSFAALTWNYLDYVLIGALAVLLIYMYMNVRKGEQIKWNDLFLYCMIGFLLFLIFFGRGIYKYYFATLTPLAIPFYSNRKGAVLFQVFCLAIILVPRAASPWMAVLLLTLVPSALAWNKPIEAQEAIPAHPT
jgi:hypothetical protein